MGTGVNSHATDQAQGPAQDGWGGTERTNPRLELAVTIALLLVFLLVLVPAFHSGASADFLALWNAGIALSGGEPSQVYPSAERPFTMLIPRSWQHAPYVPGQNGEAYPFLYPPLWAWVMGQLTRITDFGSVIAVAGWVNAALIPGMVLVAHRIAAPRMKQWLFLLLGLSFVMLPPAGIVALLQNQPQILVSFLTVLAIERAAHGKERLAGVALALAAAIKVYPALLVFLWFGAGRYRAVASFCLAGAVLGLASVALAGWPLHAIFLDLLSTITQSILVTSLSFTLDAGIAQLTMPGALTFVTAPDLPGIEGEPGGWYVMSKPLVMSLFTQIGQIGALAMFVTMLRRRPRAEAVVWPLAMMVLALLGPISWGYHYIAPLAFAPMVFGRWDMRLDRTLVLGGVLFLTLGRDVMNDLVWLAAPQQFAGLIGMVLIAAAFATHCRALWLPAVRQLRA